MNPNATDFYAKWESFGELPVRYSNKHRELRHWLVTLHNATGGNLVVHLDPKKPGVKL